MATVIRGKLKGTQFKIHQYCNNWVTDYEGHVFRISSIQFTNEEFSKIILDTKGHGELLNMFKPDCQNNKFIKRKN